jgi:hypothetical protein
VSARRLSSWQARCHESKVQPTGRALLADAARETERHKAITVNCELPYFFDPTIQDTRPSDMTRRDAALASAKEQRAGAAHLKRRFALVEAMLTAKSPFVDAIRETLRTADASIAADEKIARTDEACSRLATVAEKWDALSLRRFYALLTAGQFVRLLEAEKDQAGVRFPGALQQELEVALADFDRQAARLEAELHYSIVPIKKLATVQLLTAFYVMDYVQRR